MDDDLNLARRHRFGATASDAEQFEPVPLTDQRPDGRVAATWSVIIVVTLLLLWVVVACVWEALR